MSPIARHATVASRRTPVRLPTALAAADDTSPGRFPALSRLKMHLAAAAAAEWMGQRTIN